MIQSTEYVKHMFWDT